MVNTSRPRSPPRFSNPVIVEKTGKKNQSLSYIKTREERELEDRFKQKELSNWNEFKKNFYGYSLMVWDGLGFFGTDHMKLGRLKGEKVTFCTFLTSPRSLIMTVLGLTIASYLILTEVDNLGK